MRAIGASNEAADAPAYLRALKRIGAEEGRYLIREGSIALDENTLFRTALRLPSNLTEGAYQTRIFLTRGGAVVDSYETTIDVRKVGLERWLFTMAQQQPLIYGLMSLVIAIAAGWAASAIFTLLRR